MYIVLVGKLIVLLNLFLLNLLIEFAAVFVFQHPIATLLPRVSTSLRNFELNFNAFAQLCFFYQPGLHRAACVIFSCEKVVARAGHLFYILLWRWLSLLNRQSCAQRKCSFGTVP
jgi:hypothetical protein